MSDQNVEDQSKPANNQTTETNTSDDAGPKNNGAAPPLPAQTDSDARPASTSAAVYDAFMLGWGIVELKSRMQAARYKPEHSGLRLASVWRASFNRIAALQVKVFKTNSTVNTLYAPPGPDKLGYLYPPEKDYSNVDTESPPLCSNYPEKGIVVPTDADGKPKPILSDFKLYDVTRRAINCLSLLYVDPEKDSLIPDMIQKDQKYLIKKILEDAGKTASDPPSEQDLKDAKNKLTEWAVKFLDAWDGYLRENYYIGGSIPNNDLEMVAYEAGHSMSSLSWSIGVKTAQAEAAARKTKDAQQAEAAPQQAQAADQQAQADAQQANAAAQQPGTETQPPAAGTQQPAADAQQSQSAPESLSPEFMKAWQTVFRDEDVVRLQHQIAALSSALDDDYYKTTGQKRPTDGTVLAAPNPDLPSQAIQAVKRSLDYWQNTVKWMAQPATPEQPASDGKPAVAAKPANMDYLREFLRPDGWNKHMRLALNEQADIWQTLMTGQQSLRAYNLESVTHDIMQDINGKIQEGLQTSFSATVQEAEKLAKDVAQEAKEAIKSAKDSAVSGLEELFGLSRRRIFWLIGGVIVVFAVLLLSLFLVSYGDGKTTLAHMSGGAGISGLISAVLGYLGLGRLQAAKDEKQKDVAAQHDMANEKVNEQAQASAGQMSLLTRIEGAAEQTGAMILQALTNGYEQARIELDGLGRSVAVAYPLLEFFGSAFELKEDVTFLTSIIWSKVERDEEITRVTRAAFGPLAVFIKPPNKDSANGNRSNSADKDSGKGGGSQPGGQG
jgi:hypothetical protein